MLSLVEIMEKQNIFKDNQQGRMVAIFIPEAIGIKLHNHFKDIPGEFVPENEMHITIGLVSTNNDSNVNKILNKICPKINQFPISLDKFGYFEPNKHNHGKYILYAHPVSEQLYEIHNIIFKEFHENGIQIDNGSFDFSPHITIKYCDDLPNLNTKINGGFKVKEIGYAYFGRHNYYKLRNIK